MVSIRVKPDFGTIVDFAAVDVHEHLAARNRSDPVLSAVVPQRDYAPTSTLVTRAQNPALELLALWRAVWVGQESSTVVVDDVVFVFARLADSGVHKREYIVAVGVRVPSQDLGSVCRVTSSERYTRRPLLGHLDAVEARAIPVRHDEGWL